MPLVEGLKSVSELPHTITAAITYRYRINSFYELPDDKRPPRDLWDKPHQLSEFFDDVFEVNKGGGNRKEKYVEYDLGDVE